MVLEQCLPPAGLCGVRSLRVVGLHKINIISLDASGICSASERLQIQRVALGMYLMRRKDRKIDVVFLWDSNNYAGCWVFAL